MTWRNALRRIAAVLLVPASIAYLLQLVAAIDRGEVLIPTEGTGSLLVRWSENPVGFVFGVALTVVAALGMLVLAELLWQQASGKA